AKRRGEGALILAFKFQLVTNHNQAKILARLVKEVGTNNYNAGYAEGRAEQAFEDGKKWLSL
ncbi:MAG: hypothetical protein N4S09_04240, partial [Lactobacillus crispatus]|nr:hypothetical protein [Lactobacillus crispatus]